MVILLSRQPLHWPQQGPSGAEHSLLWLAHAVLKGSVCATQSLTRGWAAQVTNMTFLPALEATTGIPTGISTDFTKPFVSQLKINGEAPAHS